MTATTTPDLLPYPDDYEQPADVPNALEDLAAATQVALDKRMAAAPSVVGITAASGWAWNADGHGSPTVERMGRLVVCRGLIHRTSALTVADNGVYQFGTVPAGFRPQKVLRVAAAWLANNGPTAQMMTTQVIVELDGTASVVSNVAGSIQANQWVSLGGIAWVTP